MERRKFIQGVIGLAAAAAAKVTLGDDFKVADKDPVGLPDAPPIPTSMEQLDEEWAEDEHNQCAYEAWLRSKSTANPNSGRCTQCEGPLDDTRRSKATRICAPCLQALSRISGNSKWSNEAQTAFSDEAKDWEQVTKRA